MQPQAYNASETAAISVSVGVTVISCEMGTDTITGSPRVVPVYNVKGNIVGMHQVLVTPPPAPVMPDIPRIRHLSKLPVRI